MSSRPSPTSFGSRIFRAFGSGPAEIGDERRYLQDRVRLFLKTALSVVGAFYVFLAVLLAFGVPGDAVRIMTRTERVAHLGLVVVLGAGFLWVRRGERPPWVLHAIESIGAVKLCWIVPLLLAVVPSELSGEVMALQALSFILTIRAVIVPSPPLRTALVGLVGLAPLAIYAVSLRIGQGADLPFEWRALYHWRVPIWGLVLVAITTLASRVVYGLQATVREVMEVGQYQLGRKIGEGAMGAVYEATHRMLRRPTAVKMLPPERAGAEAIARFEREVLQTSRLQNPCTVAIWDFGRTPDGIFYCAMELLDGLTLSELLARHGPQSPGRVAHILRGIAESLAEAHTAGLIHRDVKPANVMLCDRGGVADAVKVLDFGLVKELGSARDAGLTHAGTLVGTPLYLSPEAITAPDAVDARADLYALGATGFELLTGTPVFRGATLVEVLSHHLHTTPETPSHRLGRPVPEALEAIVMSCLAKSPAERPTTAAALAEQLGAVADDLGWDPRAARAWWSARAAEG